MTYVKLVFDYNKDDSRQQRKNVSEIFFKRKNVVYSLVLFLRNYPSMLYMKKNCI